MTSASELFYTRRSRFGRNSLDPGLYSSVDRSFHHHSHSHSNGYRRHSHQHQNHNISNNNTRRDRHDLDGCDPLRRPPLIRHQYHRPSASERDVVQHDEGSSLSSSSNNINLDNSGGIPNSPRLGENDRLPGAVLIARERLLQRLRGISPSENRRSNRASSGNHSNDLNVGDDFRLVDAGDWETEITLSTDSISQRQRLLVPQETSKRRPGLSQEALNSLQLEVFSKAKCSDKVDMSRALQECCICLESFGEGDELMCLPCSHRFHSSCLDPWVRTCGDCPYCRRVVVVSSCIEQ